MKLIDARKDHYRKLAHEEGYRSRSAYKLKELNASYRIFGAGHFVLDLGCAPGGWTQVASKIVGNKGKVMGVDTSFVEEIPGAYMLKASINDDITEEIFLFLIRK
uniref:Ribosomal RNA methyltransferase (RlmE, rrmJ, ftsJ) n=1 Tax=uncultured marine thaumarchaeote AD1000_33_B07 TaxID=1455908 RepID=A0A075FNP0_9ARCH|nr:ribosomal RNA methyltransferase (rlmE, rrmJ, ftsJ) [uncultured marine thaumarchaeote AD1000_33_B07]